MLGGMVSSTGSGIQNLWGSDDPPKAILNRYAAKGAKSAAKLGEDLTTDVNRDAKAAFNTFMQGQPRQERLAMDQEGVLTALRDRRLAADPNKFLQDIGNTAFSFINPSVVNPTANYLVNRGRLDSLRKGTNSAMVSSTASRLADAANARRAYLEASGQAYGALPGLFNSAYAQGQANDASAAGYTPAISAAFDRAASRPTEGIRQRIGTTGGALNAAQKGIDAVLSATQGYKQPENFWDKLGKTGQQTGQQMQQEEARIMSTLASIAESMGSAEGTGGGSALGALAGGGSSVGNPDSFKPTGGGSWQAI